ncbi:MAG: response regulator [Verrucomicrobia bacterium]|nr:response regulator [Verrucomicrobiota bacterium]
MPVPPVIDDSAQAHSPSPLRILHLEDDVNDAAIIAWTLRTAGIQCRVVRVEDEESYAASLREGNVDLVLSDANVGGFSGLRALEMARAANISAPFVFVSGSATPEARAQALERGATDCLSKDHRIQLVFLVQRIWQEKLEN